MSFDGLVVLQSRLQLMGQILALGRAKLGGALEVGVGVCGPLSQRLAQRQQMALGLTHHFDEDPALAPALTAKATHGFFEAAHEHLALDLEDPG